jgi:hypothetical protein
MSASGGGIRHDEVIFDGVLLIGTAALFAASAQPVATSGVRRRARNYVQEQQLDSK